MRETQRLRMRPAVARTATGRTRASSSPAELILAINSAKIPTSDVQPNSVTSCSVLVNQLLFHGGARAEDDTCLVFPECLGSGQCAVEYVSESMPIKI